MGWVAKRRVHLSVTKHIASCWLLANINGIIVGLLWDYSGIIARYPEMKRFVNPMDPAVPSERKYDWGMMTWGLVVPSQTVAMDP